MELKKYAAAAVIAAAITGTAAGMAVPAYAAVSETISDKQAAIDSAAKVVPSNAKLVGAKTDEADFDLDYLDPATLEHYEVEVDRATKKSKKSKSRAPTIRAASPSTRPRTMSKPRSAAVIRTPGTSPSLRSMTAKKAHPLSSTRLPSRRMPLPAKPC